MTRASSMTEPERPVAIVLAGGLGTRMGPLGAAQPKHLLEVAGEPFVVHQLRWLAGHGVSTVVLATSHLAEQFAPILGDGSRWGLRLDYAIEEVPTGTAGGVRAAARLIGDLPDRVVVVNGDLLTAHDLSQQLALSRERTDTDAVLHVRRVIDARPFGCIVADDCGRVTEFVEKSPDPPSLDINAGTYVFARDAIVSMGEETSSLEREVLPALVARGRVRAYRENALWEDVGSPEALIRASSMLVRQSGHEAHLDPTAIVDPDATVSGGSAVGPGAVVHAGAEVIGSVVMAGAVVDAWARLEHGVLGPGERLRADGSRSRRR